MKKIGLILSLIFLCANLFAQTQSGLQTRLLTSFDGLSADHVRQTIEDDNGMIWFATTKGLNRYDGKNIQRYIASEDDENSLPHNNITSMLLSKTGELWIGTQGGLVKKLKNDHFIQINNETLGKKVFPSEQIIKLLQSKNGNIWVATQKGLVIMDPEMKDYHTYKNATAGVNFPTNDIANMFEDKFGNIWISTWSAGVILASSKQINDIHNIKFSFLTNEDLALPKNITFTQIFQDHTDKIWMQESYGILYRFDINNLSSITQLNPEAVSITMHDFGIFDNHKNHITTSNYIEGIGMIVCTTKKSLLIPDTIIESPNKNSSKGFIELDGLNIGIETKQEIYIDSRKIIWIASNKGVFMQFGFINNLFQKYPAYQSFTDDIRLSAIFHDDRGTWMGTDDGLYLDNELTLKEIKKGTESIKFITSFTKTENGDLWLGNILGELFQLKEINGSNTIIKHRLHVLDQYKGANHIWNILEESEGILWLATHAGVLIYNTNTKTVTTPSDPIFDKYAKVFNCFDIVKDKQGKIYISATGFGIYVGTPNSRNGYDFELKKQGSGAGNLSSNVVFDLEIDDGLIWIAQSIGVEIYNIELDSFYRMPILDKSLNGQVFSIVSVEDKVWFTTPSGLTSYNKKENTSYNFNILDGLIENHSMLGHFKDSNGDVYLAGAGGYHKLKTEEKYLQKETKSVMLSQLKINNKQMFVGEDDDHLGHPILTEELNKTDEITLSYYHKNIVFDFSVQDFISPHQYEYSYILEGISEDWINLGQEQKIMFSQLPEQNFKLGIKAIDQFGNSTETKYLSINVNIPFWKHPSTMILLGLFSLLSIYLGMKYQQHKVKVRNSELEKAVQRRTITLKKQNEKLETYIESNMKLENFAHAASHDLKAPMNNIAAFAGLLKEELEGKIEGEASMYFNEIERGTSRLNDLIDDILAYSTLKSENVSFSECSISEMINEVLHSLDATIKSKNAIVHFEQKENSKKMMLDNIKISRVIQNLITNALKFIPKEKDPIIRIWSEQDDENHYIHIKDNGIGISEENQIEIFKMFKRVGHTNNYDGTGFGLTISKKIMELHQGDLKVTSTLGMGSTFTLLFPREAVKVNNSQLPQQRAKTS